MKIFLVFLIMGLLMIPDFGAEPMCVLSIVKGENLQLYAHRVDFAETYNTLQTSKVSEYE